MASTDDQRATTGRSWSNRSSKNPQQQLTTIEKSVTHLLVATKQLLETLTKWSRGAATETEVSDVYVRLGYEFNIACRAFNAINVDTSDLGPVPELLRKILEDTLSQEANQQSLDRYLPEIRDIIIKLLHGLKKKQQRLRQKAGSNGESSVPARQASTVSTMSLESNLTQQLDELPSRTTSSRSAGHSDVLPPRTSSVPHRVSPQNNISNTSPRNSVHRSRETMSSDSSLSSNAMQNIPVIAPYPEVDSMPVAQPEPHTAPDYDNENLRPPPQQNDALTALQKGGDLERRASRRFSAYQIQKHLGTSMNGISAIPPPQHSPIPNRGRDVRESMSAVRSRRSVLNRSRNRDGTGYESTPSSLHNEVRRISEEPSKQIEILPPQLPNEPLESPIIKTPPDKIAGYPFPETQPAPQDVLGATLNGPMQEPFAPFVPDTSVRDSKVPIRRQGVARDRIQTPPPPALVPDSSPQAGKELTLFLQYKSKIKKFVLSDGADLTMARLQLAFIEKFAWNTHNNGVDLPEIYIQDPVSGVRHELEDLGDIKERSVLVLNVEALDEVKRHIDEGLGGLRRVVEGIKSSLDHQQSAIDLVSSRQQESAKELAGLAVSRTDLPAMGLSRSLSMKDKAGQLREVQSLRRDLAIMRQTYSSFASDMTASMSTIRSKAASVKTVAETSVVPVLDGNTGRAYVNKGKKSLSDDSEKIVNRVDDLQDTVEDLRKDVVTRGVRPLTRQLEDVSKDISTATTDLKKLQQYLKREKPIWTKIWEKELQVVCDDRDLLTMQEDLAADLEDDLEKAAATFALVEEATKAQNLQNSREGTPGVRTPSRTVLQALAEDQGADPEKARDGVLGEVRALQPNHESRLEAIERAEKARQRELESRLEGTRFKKELKTFVLKKSGGVEEVERVRLLKDEMARRENHETKIRRTTEQDVGDAAPRDTFDLQVPESDTAREGSPEPVFVEAPEDAVPHAQ
ncbi:hypothetical protein AMS68_002391 [Peltaster fructicola]|uniref:Actin interacting protein 3 C-terminal domain-containing protein n=1 Tax=Peltaster fructicola TaxID=286661 RepID=A0A6H0XQ62_9PEZI|nr:hypothetical protein AMS68_002391 [Peltaster fructicola]